MTHFPDHAADSRCVLFLDHLRDFVEAEGLKGAFLVDRITDLALDLFDFYCCPIRTSLSSKYFLHGNATLSGDGISITHLAESLDGGFHEVVGVGRAF